MVTCKKCGEAKVASRGGTRLRWRCRPCEATYQRQNYAANIDHRRAVTRERMKRLRRTPGSMEKLRESSRRAYRNGGNEKQRKRIARMQVEQPFRWRAQLLRRRLGWPITEHDLIALWDAQDGRCGLTGQPMDVHDAEIDHIVPISRGGGHELANLRWTTRPANQAKGDLLDHEFLALCTQVAEHIGRMILEAGAR